MKIQATTYNDKKNTFIVEIENEKLEISYPIFEKYQISTGKDIDEKTYEDLTYESHFQNAKNKVLLYLSYTQRTEKQVLDKLKKMGLDYQTSLKLINEFKDLGLLDDEAFAIKYAEEKSIRGESKRKIKSRLYQKGLPQDLIAIALNALPDEDESTKALSYIKKKFNSLDDDKTRQKAYNQLAYRGFNYSDIKRAIRLFNENIENGKEDF